MSGIWKTDHSNQTISDKIDQTFNNTLLTHSIIKLTLLKADSSLCFQYNKLVQVFYLFISLFLSFSFKKATLSPSRDSLAQSTFGAMMHYANLLISFAFKITVNTLYFRIASCWKSAMISIKVYGVFSAIMSTIEIMGPIH